MNFLHYNFQLNTIDVVEVTLNTVANVRLLDPTNFLYYQNGRKYKHFGGAAKPPKFTISPPYKGSWNVVIDLAGLSGDVNASVKVIRG
ncbi:MAG: DUF1883 domain-containing protein [Spirochaetaceae bacterium]|nr:DUF1883 domain-containing protein [Spirochaetaceae bacterium]